MFDLIKQKWNIFIHSPWFIPLRMVTITFIVGLIFNIIFFTGIKFGFDLNIFAFHFNTTPLILLFGAVNFVLAFLIVKLSTWFPGNKEFCTPDVNSIEIKSNNIYEKIEVLSEELESRDLELQRSEFKYRNLFTMLHTMANNIPDIIWSKNIKGKYQFINDIGANLFFNTVPDDVIGKTDIELLSDLPNRQAFINKFIELDQKVVDTTTQITSIETIEYCEHNMTFEIIKSPIISKLGKMEGVIGCARNITSKIKNEKIIERKEQALELILYASREFLKENDWEKYLKNFITRLGSVMEVERVLLFKRDFEKKSDYEFNLDYEWALNRKYLFTDFPYIKNMSLKEKFPRWLSMFQQGNIIKGNIVDFLDDERIKLEKQGIKSTLCVPILIEKRLWGFIGFDNFEDERIWDPMEIKVLKTSANIISAAIEQQYYLNKLKNSEEQFRKIFEKINSALILINAETLLIEEVNKTALHLIGYSNSSELIGKKYKEGFCGITTFQIDQHNSVGDVVFEEPFECSCIDRNGKTRNCIKSISNVYIQDKKFILLNFMNVTDKKSAEDTLNYQRNRYRQLIEKFNELILEVEIPSGNIKYVNIDFSDNYNLNSNMTIDTLIKTLVVDKHQEQLLEILENARLGIVPNLIEFQAIDAKGKKIWVESACNPITTETGDVIGLEIICRNVTTRKKLFLELQIKKDFQDTIINNVPVGLFYKDEYGKYVFCNDEFAKIVNLSKNQIIGNTVRDVLDLANSKITEEKDREILETSFTPQQYEIYLKSLDRYVYVNKIITRDDKNNVIGIIGSIVDRSEIVKSKKEIEFEKKIYNKTLNDLVYPAFIRDNDNIIRVANYEFCKLFEKEQCDNMLITSITKDTDIINTLLKDDEKLKTQNSFESDISLNIRGYIRTFKMRKSIFNHDSQNYILTTLRDNTDQTKLIEKLENVKKLYRKTIDSFNSIIFVVDENLKLILYNDKFENFLDSDNKENPEYSYIFSKSSLFSQNIKSEYNKVLNDKITLQTDKSIYLNGVETEVSILKIPIIENNNVNYIVTLMKYKGEIPSNENLSNDRTEEET